MGLIIRCDNCKKEVEHDHKHEWLELSQSIEYDIGIYRNSRWFFCGWACLSQFGEARAVIGYLHSIGTLEEASEEDNE